MSFQAQGLSCHCSQTVAGAGRSGGWPGISLFIWPQGIIRWPSGASLQHDSLRAPMQKCSGKQSKNYFTFHDPPFSWEESQRPIAGRTCWLGDLAAIFGDSICHSQQEVGLQFEPGKPGSGLQTVHSVALLKPKSLRDLRHKPKDTGAQTKDPL